MKRTGSIASSVGPAVTTTDRPVSPWDPPSASSITASMRSRVARRPGPTGCDRRARGELTVDDARRRDLLLVAMTFAAGAVDAVVFLRLDVFTAVMTGNIVLLGLAIGQGAFRNALRSLIALLAYSVGVVAGADRGHDRDRIALVAEGDARSRDRVGAPSRFLRRLASQRGESRRRRCRDVDRSVGRIDWYTSRGGARPCPWNVDHLRHRNAHRSFERAQRTRHGAW